jgi:hypothetical protein
LAQPRTYTYGGHDYQLVLVDHGVEIRNDLTLLVEKDEMLDLRQQLRRNGFASDVLTPTGLEGRVQYLLPLVAELPYVRPVRVGRTYSDITGRHAHGLQFLPRVDGQRTKAPRTATVVQSDTTAAQTRLPI